MDEEKSGIETEPTHVEETESGAASSDIFGAPVTEAVPPKDNRKKKYLIAGIAAGVIILAAVGIIVYQSVIRSPLARITRGFVNMGQECLAYTNPVIEEIGLTQIIDNWKEGASHSDMRLNLTSPLYDAVTLGIDVGMDYDYLNKRMALSMEASFANIVLMTLQYIQDKESAYVTMPDFYEGSLMVDAIHTGKSFHQSVWAQMYDVEVEEDFSLDAFSDAQEKDEMGQAGISEEFAAAMTKDGQAVADSMVIEATDEFLSIEQNGKEVKCDGFQVTLVKEEVNVLLSDWWEELSQGPYAQQTKQLWIQGSPWMTEAEADALWEESIAFFHVRLGEDLKLTVYLDKKDRIIHMALPENMTLETEEGMAEIAFAADLKGVTRTLDEVQGSVTYRDVAGAVTLEIDRNAVVNTEKYTNDWNVSLTAVPVDGSAEETYKVQYHNGWNLAEKEYECKLLFEEDEDTIELLFNGAVGQVEKGSKFTVDIGSMQILLREECVAKLTGSFTIEPLKQTIAVPESDVRDLFNMPEAEANALLEEFSVKLARYLNRL